MGEELSVMIEGYAEPWVDATSRVRYEVQTLYHLSPYEAIALPLSETQFPYRRRRPLGSSSGDSKAWLG